MCRYSPKHSVGASWDSWVAISHPHTLPQLLGWGGPWYPLTLDIPGSPDGVVEADLVSAEQLETFEILPLGRHQLTTVRGRGLG